MFPGVLIERMALVRVCAILVFTVAYTAAGENVRCHRGLHKHVYHKTHGTLSAGGRCILQSYHYL